MPFTVQELENIASATIDFHMDQGKVWSQTIQNKPLLAKLKKMSKAFPGGKENITVRVKGEYTTEIQGFTADDQVTYGNPANLRTAVFPWKLVHSGIGVTYDELAKNGISINTSNGKSVSKHTDREKLVLADLLDDKIEDMIEGTARGMNSMFWNDGTADSKLVPGLLSFILDDPTSATVVAGIDQSTNTWWRNRANVSIDSSTASNNNLINVLQAEIRQLRRYGGNPRCFLAGSDFLDALEKEMRAKGTYTDSGWAKTGRMDASMADLAFKGIEIEYDPTLDDLGRAKYGYLLDLKDIGLRHIDGEEDKNHNPERPYDRYVMYRARTWMGGMVCRRRNSSGVYAIQ